MNSKIQLCTSCTPKCSKSHTAARWPLRARCCVHTRLKRRQARCECARQPYEGYSIPMCAYQPRHTDGCLSSLCVPVVPYSSVQYTGPIKDRGALQPNTHAAARGGTQPHCNAASPLSLVYRGRPWHLCCARASCWHGRHGHADFAALELLCAHVAGLGRECLRERRVGARLEQRPRVALGLVLLGRVEDADEAVGE